MVSLRFKVKQTHKRKAANADVAEEKTIKNLGLYEGAKRPKCNPDFTSEI